MSNHNRKEFRETVFSRDDNECIVPWCESTAEDAHHLIERDLWKDGGYIPNNGVSVCNHHHQAAETNDIPPQSFWMWIGIEKENIKLPDTISTWQVDKWGDEFDTPAWEEHRERIKYQSSRHLLPLYWHDEHTTADERMDNDDTGLTTIEDFVGIPLVITEKMDGGNMMIVNDMDQPVRARNGKTPKDTMELMYDDLYWRQEVHEKLPERLQVFGEWLWGKHSIHYGCECDNPCDDIGPYLSEYVDYDNELAYFQIFGVYDKVLNVWLSWPEVERIAEILDFPTVPVLYQEESDQATFETKNEARQTLIDYARDVIDNGGEGIVVRSKYPFHFGQFSRKLGKYVRENHVEDREEHWSKSNVIQNNIKEDAVGRLIPEE